MQHIIYCDIETVPAGPKIDPATMPHPAIMKKEETIAKWRSEKAPQEAEALYRKRALKSMEGEIVCICWAYDDGEVKEKFFGNDAREIINWSEWLKTDILQHELITWVGHNILTFDRPWIWRRAVKYDLAWLVRQIRLDRYRGNVEDTMLMWRGADNTDYTSLDNLAKWLGVGESVGSGADVYDWFLAGDFEKIVEHCKSDVSTVRAVYKKIKGE